MAGISQTNLDVMKQYVGAAPQQTSGFTTTVKGVAIPVGIVPILAPSYQNVYRWLASGDYNISESDQLRVRYVANNISRIDISAALPAFYFPRPTNAKLFSASEFHAFQPSLANELRLAYNRFSDNISVPDDAVSRPGYVPQHRAEGLGNADRTERQRSAEGCAEHLSDRRQPDLDQGQSQPEVRIRRTRQYVLDQLHLQHSRQLPIPDSRSDTCWIWSPIFRRSAPSAAAKPYSGNNYALYGFANDDWKVTRNFSVSLGLRYEFTAVPRSMQEYALNSMADVPGVLTFFAPQPQNKNFAPRIGFAYSPGKSATTSIRGGFGIAYDQIFDNIGLNVRPPEVNSVVNSVVTDTPGYLAGRRHSTQRDARQSYSGAGSRSHFRLAGQPAAGLRDQLEFRRAARFRKGLCGGCPLSGNQRRSSADADAAWAAPQSSPTPTICPPICKRLRRTI